jgi:hypothetical protein
MRVLLQQDNAMASAVLCVGAFFSFGQDIPSQMARG